jgi:hypothetical protein
MKVFFKIYKILTSLYLLILILGFIFSARIRDNAIGLFEIFSSEGSVGALTGVILFFFSVLIFWFAPKTMVKLFSSKGSLKNFWNDV